MGFPHNCEGDTHWGVLGTMREQGSYRGVGRYPGQKQTNKKKTSVWSPQVRVGKQRRGQEPRESSHKGQEETEALESLEWASSSSSLTTVGGP